MGRASGSLGSQGRGRLVRVVVEGGGGRYSIADSLPGSDATPVAATSGRENRASGGSGASLGAASLKPLHSTKAIGHALADGFKPDGVTRAPGSSNRRGRWEDGGSFPRVRRVAAARGGTIATARQTRDRMAAEDSRLGPRAVEAVAAARTKGRGKGRGGNRRSRGTCRKEAPREGAGRTDEDRRTCCARAVADCHIQNPDDSVTRDAETVTHDAVRIAYLIWDFSCGQIPGFCRWQIRNILVGCEPGGSWGVPSRIYVWV